MKIEQIEFLDERFYKVKEDVYYPSVTHILQSYPKGAAFTQWLKDVGNNAKYISERAMESGSKVHNAIESIIKENELIWNDKLYDLFEWKGILAFEDFYINFVDEVLACETKIYSHKYKYAGTIDFVGRLNDGNIWMIDYKFGNAVYNSYFLQIVAYRSAWNENSEIKINKHGILHLKAKTRGRREGRIQGLGWQLIEPKQDYETLFKIWNSTLNIHYFEFPENKPKNEIYPAKIKLESKWKTI